MVEGGGNKPVGGPLQVEAGLVEEEAENKLVSGATASRRRGWLKRRRKISLWEHVIYHFRV